MSPEAVIEVRDLSMRYADRDVLRGVSFTVHRAEVFALLGPNGAGKTSTVEILEGFRSRSGGYVRVLGADPEKAGPAWRQRIGVVLQTARDHQYWQVRQLLDHFASFYPDPWEVSELLDLLGLRASATQVCRKLSGGQRRRLDVALGIIGRPELLFLDEPTTGFDAAARRDYHELLLRLRSSGMSMVLTTHDLQEADKLADRLAVLHHGAIVAGGTTEELARRARARSTVQWTEAGVPQRELSAEPSELVWDLHQRLGGPIDGLVVHRPTLEDIYLATIAEGVPA